MNMSIQQEQNTSAVNTLSPIGDYKLITYLAMSGVPFEVDKSRSKDKVDFLVANSKIVTDLIAKYYSDPVVNLKAWLTAESHVKDKMFNFLRKKQSVATFEMSPK